MQYNYCYILELERPLGNLNNPKGMARYYTGRCKDVNSRLETHRLGLGSDFTKACVREGIRFHVAIVFPYEEGLERKIKNQKNAPRLVRQLRRGHVPEGLPTPLFVI